LAGKCLIHIGREGSAAKAEIDAESMIDPIARSSC
jgi:hypothetical protein